MTQGVLSILLMLVFSALIEAERIDNVTVHLTFNCAHWKEYEIRTKFIEIDDLKNDEGDWIVSQCNNQQCKMHLHFGASGDGLWNNEYELALFIIHNCTKSRKREQITLSGTDGYYNPRVGKDTEYNQTINA